jgi:uncharacterized membrane protein
MSWPWSPPPSGPRPTIGDQLRSIDLVSALQLAFGAILTYGGYRWVKKKFDDRKKYGED